MLPCSFLLDFLLIGDLMMFLIGAYDDEEAAARAYDLAALKYWGPGTLINFPVRLLLTWFFHLIWRWFGLVALFQKFPSGSVICVLLLLDENGGHSFPCFVFCFKKCFC
jgi:hypothetical protein